MEKEKRAVYAGYEEQYMTGQEIIDLFSNAYECYGRHHEQITAYKMDWSYKKKIKPENTYRVFINDLFCAIFDADTDQKLYFFGYTMEAPPWAKEGKKPPQPKYCTAEVEVLQYYIANGEIKKEFVKKPFTLISDENKNIITDLVLLRLLYDIRFLKHFPAYITNMALVGLATYKPLTKEDFIAIKGLTEETYNICGEQFIKAIQDYIDYKNSKSN